MLLRIFLCLCPPLGSIATGYLAIDDHWPDRLLGSPVRGVEGEIKEKAEDGREFRRQMRRKTVTVRHGTGSGEQVQEPSQQMAACDCGAMRGDLTARDTIAHRERVLEHGLDVARPGRSRMRLGDLAAPPDQMGQTGLMRRLIELAIRRPPIPHEDAVELGAEHRR